VFLVALCLLFLQVQTAGAASPVYPLKVSDNGRYLTDTNGSPVLLILGDAQGIMVDLSLTDTATYFASRAAHGVNAVWINLFCDTVFNGRADWSDIDGNVPFTASAGGYYNLDYPNEAYFNRVGQVIDLAKTYGITVVLDAGGLNGIDLPMYLYNTTQQCTNFGTYLGNKFKNYDNLIWLYGNDFTTWMTQSAHFIAMSNAIKTAENNRHLQTVQGYPSSTSPWNSGASRDNTSWDSIINLDTIYSLSADYVKIHSEYSLSPAKPIGTNENVYEGESWIGYPVTPLILRKQNYWSLTAGACGVCYGTAYDWKFPSGWLSSLDSTGAQQLKIFSDFFNSLEWWKLVPDGISGSNHLVMTAGYGNYGSPTSPKNTDTYATCARASDGSFIVAYLPTSRQVTIDMSKLATTATAQWFDPTNGTYAQISGSPFANTGLLQFTPPGNNHEGNGDWVLVLETTSAPPSPTDTQPPTAPAGLTASVVSQSQINLYWGASTDNVGVTKYFIERCQYVGLSCSNFSQIATTTETAYSSTGLTASTSYGYQVRASDAAGNLSLYSNIATATTLTATPSPTLAAPVNLKARAVSRSQINLSWTDNSTNESGFAIERCSGYNCSNFSQIALVGANVKTYSDPGLSRFAWYSYRVRSHNVNRNSTYSNKATAMTRWW
jgi:hypothetical protein